jgi:predicted GNAT superfamily acetyltransferase
MDERAIVSLLACPFTVKLAHYSLEFFWVVCIFGRYWYIARFVVLVGTRGAAVAVPLRIVDADATRHFAIE